MRRAFAISLTLAALLGGCAKFFGTVVDMPRDNAAAMIYNMPSAANLMGMPLGLSGTHMSVARSEDGVTWTYTRDGKPACAFTAFVSEESSETSLVWSEVSKLGGSGDEYDYMCSAVNVLGKESVAATLESRAADKVGAQQQIAALAPAHMASVYKEIGKELQRQTSGSQGGGGCSDLGTSAAQASCNGTRGLKDPTDRRY